VNYFIHEPSIVLFFRRNSVQLASVFESDTYFLGDVQQRWNEVERLAQQAAAQGRSFYSAAVDNNWVSYRWMYNSGFLNEYSAKGLLHKWEHVEYFSRGFASQLDAVLQRGLAAHGEEFAASVCNGSEECEMEDLNGKKMYSKTPSKRERREIQLCLDDISKTGTANPPSCRSELIFGQFYHKILREDKGSEICKIAFSNSSTNLEASIWT